MKAFSTRRKDKKVEKKDQKFKFVFTCEFELYPEEIWDGDPPMRPVTVEEVLDHIEISTCDSLEFLCDLSSSGYISTIEGEMDVEEVTKEEEGQIEADDDDILGKGSIAEATSLNDVVGNLVAGDAIKEMVRG